MGGKKKADKEKPLDKMTAKELRDIAKEMEEITGAFGMNKPELIAAIKKARGIVDTGPQKDTGAVRKMKTQIKALKVKRQQALDAEDQRSAAILRKKIIKLKKRTRRAA